MDRIMRRARPLGSAILATALLLGAARADAATPVGSAAVRPADQVLLSTAQVRATSGTTADIVGLGADAGVGRVHVQIENGDVATAPAAFWSELWKSVKSRLAEGCTRVVKEISFQIGPYPVTVQVTEIVC